MHYFRDSPDVLAMRLRGADRPLAGGLFSEKATVGEAAVGCVGNRWRWVALHVASDSCLQLFGLRSLELVLELSPLDKELPWIVNGPTALGVALLVELHESGLAGTGPVDTQVAEQYLADNSFSVVVGSFLYDLGRSRQQA